MIELTAPQTVNGRRARYQSLWLLVRLVFAARFQADGMVRLSDLRGQVSDARTIRMVITRAFRDWSAWGVMAGWGEDRGRDPRLLNADKRSQGPFWLPAAECEGIRCLVRNAEATPEEMAAFLGLPAASCSASPPAAAFSEPGLQWQNLGFWKHFLHARQAAHAGRLLAPVWDAAASGHSKGAIAELHVAKGLAADDFQHAFVSLTEAQLWRRLGDYDQARRALQALRRQRREQHVLGNDYLDAMDRIVSAWCAYDQRDLLLAVSLLESMGNSEPCATLVRYHPHVRYERSNLLGLAYRARALGASAAESPAALAQSAFGHFEQALAAAFESNSTDAAQHVAANLGMTLWLCHEAGIDTGNTAPAVREQAIRWVAMSEWLCAQSGSETHSAWNAIYLMRIARGGGLPVLPVTSLSASAEHFAGVFVAPRWPASWADIARLRLEEHERGTCRYATLQVACLLFEYAWYAGHEARWNEALAARAKLLARLPELSAPDRAFFTGTLLPQLAGLTD